MTTARHIGHPEPFEDPDHPGNRIRLNIQCVGCGKLGCITAWGPWCFDCNVARIRRINRAFEPIRRAIRIEGSET